MTWSRPASLAFPSIWHRFQVPKSPLDPTLISYVIQDLPEDRFDDGLRFMCSHFSYDEQMNRALDDPQAKQEERSLWAEMLRERLSLVCFREGSPDIVALNVLGVTSRNDQAPRKFDSAIYQIMFDTVQYMAHRANVFERYGVEHYLEAMGLSVDPEHRGRGVATELLRARVPLARAVGLRLTATCFTGEGSQVVAARAGFREDFVATYRELRGVDQRFDFPGLDGELCKYMSLQIL